MKRKILAGLALFIITISSSFTVANDAVPSDAFKQEFLYRINKVRAVGCDCGNKHMPPVPPLTWNDFLTVSAAGHAQDMNYQNYFSHDSKDGRNIEDRIVMAGYIFKGYRSFAIGENIAYGQRSIAEVTDGWFQSEGHCKNLMNPSFKEIGIARNGLYWVQDFGGRESFTPEEQKMMRDPNVKMTFKRVKIHD
ncbi:CAP domain-containing protein [Mucilaginibacter ginkgonis]|uniref:CAP domain-containing protein n=1 Tax=Mucilaginibacter ginkgonis TaxID=2682091 RepID=A0A6I4I302_9SPHI|nr:CAP domain-containing protein [Mucilaginibacter ginkgonis]QQL50905.1 CAP domain-containing protein [Mucilaginibacter ginkgonis]